MSLFVNSVTPGGMMLFSLLLGQWSGASVMGLVAALCGMSFIVGDAGPAGMGPAPTGAGGGTPTGDPSGSSTDQELEIIRDEPAGASAAAADEDEDPDEDDSHISFRDDPAYKRIKNDRRNLQRKLSKVRSVAEAVRSAGVPVADLIAGHRQAREFNEALQRNPELARLLRGGSAPAEGGGRPATRAPAAFTEEDFPYDTSTPEGKYFFEQMKAANATGQRVQQLEAMVNRLVGHIGGGERQRVEQAWKSKTEDAAKTLPEKIRVGKSVYHVREMFSDTVYGALQHARNTGVRVTPELVDKVISHYRREMAAGGGPANPGAAQQRIAENNRTLPRAGQLGGGSPASPRTRETVQQVSARLRRQAAAGG